MLIGYVDPEGKSLVELNAEEVTKQQNLRTVAERFQAEEEVP